jgi:hypothetical protein
MKVRVRDQEYFAYEKTAEASVKVFVNRNRQSPFFIGTYGRDISENTPVSTSLIQVSAQDNDMRVCT